MSQVRILSPRPLILARIGAWYGICPTASRALRGRRRVCSTINIRACRVANRRIQMRLALSCALLAGTLLCLSACNKAESPEKVQEDVAKAQSKAAEENAKADEKVKQVEADAAKDRADA